MKQNLFNTLLLGVCLSLSCVHAVAQEPSLSKHRSLKNTKNPVKTIGLRSGNNKLEVSTLDRYGSVLTISKRGVSSKKQQLRLEGNKLKHPTQNLEATLLFSRGARGGVVNIAFSPEGQPVRIIDGKLQIQNFGNSKFTCFEIDAQGTGLVDCNSPKAVRVVW